MRIDPPQTDTVFSDARSQDEPNYAPMPLEEPLDPETYVCGPGDAFELTFWGKENSRIPAVVDLEGRLFITKVGFVAVAGKTLAETRATVKKAVARYYPGLRFDLSLAQPRTFLVHVVGLVSKPGTYRATPLERVAGLLGRVGSVGGSHRRIKIRRRDGTSVIADLVKFGLTGDTELNPYLRDGDVIEIPVAKMIVEIDGPVYRPGRYELVDSCDLAELLQLAGGLKSSATRSLPIRVVRRDEHERSSTLRLTLGADGSIPEVPLRDDDEVHVPATEELQPSVLLVGAVVGADPSDEVTTLKRLPYVKGDTVRLLIERAGGIVAAGDLKGAYIVRGDDKKVIPVDLEAILVRRDFQADQPVREGDTIVVPYRRESVMVQGAVVRPGPYQYNPKLHMRSYVNLAGGTTRLARSLGDARVIRSDGTYESFSDAGRVKPGDTIVVPERDFSRSEVVSLVMSGVSLALTAVLVGIQVFKN